MKLKISRLAAFKIEKLLDYLTEEWSESVRDDFLKKMDSRFKAVLNAPKGFQKSELKPELRKVVITRQTSALYKIKEDTIFIVTIFDNRQYPKFIEEEIRNNFG